MDTQQPEDDNRDELEYNDGLGDLLREKEKLEFSWTKTTIVLVVVIGVIFLGLTFLFNFGKNVITKSQQISEDAVIEAQLSDIETENQELLKMVNKSLVEKKASDPFESNQEQKKKINQEEARKKLENLYKKEAYPFKVIAGTFSKQANATVLKKQLEKSGINNFVWKSNASKPLYRVQVGAFKTRKEATDYKTILTNKGVSSYIMNL